MPGILVELPHAAAHWNRRLLRRGGGALLSDRVSGGGAVTGSARSPRSLDAYPLARRVHEVLRPGRLAGGGGTDAVLRPQARQSGRRFPRLSGQYDPPGAAVGDQTLTPAMAAYRGGGRGTGRRTRVPQARHHPNALSRPLRGLF